MQNEPGVLSRVSGILAARGFNIDSLVVAKTEVHDLSRMTIIFRGKSAQIEQARRQLEDLVSFVLFFFFCTLFDGDRGQREREVGKSHTRLSNKFRVFMRQVWKSPNDLWRLVGRQ